MKFIRYSRFKGFDVSGIDLGGLMDALSNQMLDSGYNEDYWWTREMNEPDDSLDALRQAILQSLLEQEILSDQDVAEMLADNDGKFKGSILEQLINQLIERMVEEGYLTLKELPREPMTQPGGKGGQGEVGEAMPRNIKFELTEKGFDFLGYKTLQNLLGSIGKSSIGRHETNQQETGVEASLSSKPYEFGDVMNLDVTSTIVSALVREGSLDVPMNLEYSDLWVYQSDYRSSCATVVMLDCSHSMILYGEDRFTPAKKVALALAHLIRTQYPGDTLKVVLFHDSAEEVPLGKLGSMQVGPHHTNTAEGLKLARRLLTAQRKDMKQIVMITDGKPTAAFMDDASAASFRRRSAEPVDGGKRMLYKNSMGNDPYVMAETFKEVQACRKSGVMINTFMLADDPSLVEFVKKMTAITRGKAYFANPNNLTEFVLMDFLKRRTQRVK
ncbi:MAG: VWA domain-containing protein [bacterium]|nr:VWA domain-containing protein [bacterium]